MLDLAKTGEAYIYADFCGDADRIKNKITIPTNCYKIMVVLPEGDGDLQRINSKTRIIAVDMPNDVTVSSR
jgi:endonuclease G